MTDSSSHPNALPGLAADGTDPNAPGERPLPGQFDRVAMIEHPDPQADVSRLDLARAGRSPNAIEGCQPDRTAPKTRIVAAPPGIVVPRKRS